MCYLLMLYKQADMQPECMLLPVNSYADISTTDKRSTAYRTYDPVVHES